MTRRAAVPTIPKLCGADVELGNFVAGPARLGGTGAEAARLLLRAMTDLTRAIPAETVPVWTRGRRGRAGRGGRGNPQDSGRVYLPANGGCAYIDLDHLELCLPEVVSAYDHVAAWHAMLRLAQAALADVNADRAPEHRVRALVNNSDGRGNSYGGHLNVLLTRPAWDGVMQRKLHHLAFLASYQASAVLFTGQGKVGSENDAPPARYQLSQRADFIETMLGPQTTFYRPLVNSRDEPHSDHARLHLICFDSTLAPAACLLRVGVTQLILAMLEADRVNPRLALDDPLAALQVWSRDSRLEQPVRLATGQRVTAVELQLRFLEHAQRYAARGGFEGIVPRAAELLDLWQDTLERLARRDWPVLARRLDWVMKLAMLERALAQRPELDWEAPELRYLDQLYGSLDPSEGLFWAWTRAGLVDGVVAPEQVDHFCKEPPPDTRAWSRAMLLRQAGPEAIEQVDWDAIRFRLDGEIRPRRLALPNPLGATRAEWGEQFGRGRPLAELLDALGARPDPGRGLIRIATAGYSPTPMTPNSGGGYESA